MAGKKRTPTIQCFSIVVIALVFVLAPLPSHFLQAQDLATPVPELPAEETSTPTPALTAPSAEATTVPISTSPDEIPEETLPSTPTVGTPSTEATENPISPAAVIPGGSLQGCTQAPLNGDITTGAPSRIVCTLRVANRTSSNTANQWGGIKIPSLPAGFSASVAVTGITSPVTFTSGSSSVWRYFHFGNGVNGYRSATVTITISTTAAAGTRVSVTFESCSAGQNGISCNPDNLNPGSALVTGQVPSSSILPLVEGTHYTFTCTAIAPAVSFNIAMESTCRITIPPTVGSLLAPLLVSEIVTTHTGGSGWTLETFTVNNQKIAGIPGVYSYPTLARPALNLVGDSYSFKVRMTPNGCSSEQNTNISVSLGLRRALVVIPGPVQYSPARLLQGARTPSSASASVFAQPGDVELPYSMSSPVTGSTSFRIRYNVVGCESWAGYVRLGPFSNTADPMNRSIAIQTSAVHGPIVQNPTSRTVLTLPPLSTIRQTPTHVLSGTAPGQQVTVDQTINLIYTVPANTPAGSYQSTITVSTVNAP